jgi:hypothetical protein
MKGLQMFVAKQQLLRQLFSETLQLFDGTTAIV